MGVYIKNWALPDGVMSCSAKINPDERKCIFTGKVFEETFELLTERRCKDCPLIEVKAPHGRLIDEDDIHTGIRMEKNTEYRYFIDRVNAPTVIEAEYAENDKRTTKCAVCKQEILDDEYIFTTMNGNEIVVCEACLLRRPEEVEKAVAAVNVN